MSQATPQSTPPTGSGASAAPAKNPAGTAPQRARQTGPTVDPIRVLRQHVKLLVASTIGGAVLGGAAHFVQAWAYPVWTGRVVFEINNAVKNATDITMAPDQEDTVARIGQTESQRLMTKSVLEAAMKAPDVSATAWGKEYPSVDERVEELEKTLKSGHMRGTSNYAISWSTQEKTDVPVILNRIATTYIEQRRSEEEEGYGGDLQKFEDRRKSLDDELRNQSTAIQAFIAAKGVTDSTSSHQELRNKIQHLAGLRDEAVQELTSAKAQLLIVDQQIESGTYEDSMRREAADDYSMRQLEQSLHAAQVALASKSQRLGEDHQEIKALKNQVRSAEEKYEGALRELMQRNLLAAKRNLSERVSRLEAAVQRQTADLADYERKLNELTASLAELDLMKERQKSMEADRAETQKVITQSELLRVREGAQRVRLRQLASTPREMSFPKLEYYIPLGAVLGLGLATGIVFLREFLDQRIRQPSDLMGIAGCRFLGVIPDITDDPSAPEAAERVVRTHPNSVTAEMFRQIAARARKAVDLGKVRTIAVVAAHPGAGTTTLVTNLAASASSAGRRTAVVDANFRRPRLAAALGADPEAPGLGNLLQGEDVQPQMVDGIAVYGAGPASTRVFERLQGDEMARTIARLRDKYDLVLIDLPPSLVAGESMVIVHASDASILVVRAMEDLRGLVGKTVGQLLDTHATLIGSVLMRPMHTAGGYFKKNAEIMAEYAKEPVKAS